MPAIDHQYTLAQLENLYRDIHPDAPRSEVRRAAKKEYRRQQPDASRINGLSWLHDPTPAKAFVNIHRSNDGAAKRRLGLA